MGNGITGTIATKSPFGGWSGYVPIKHSLVAKASRPASRQKGFSMSNHRAITQLVKAISGQSNVLTIPRIYIALTGSHRAALLLSQCVYWSDKGADGWFYKTYDDWKSELGIPRGGIDTALRDISRWVNTDVRQVGGTPKKHYKVMYDLLVSDISDLLENSTSTITKTTKTSIRADAPEELRYDGYLQ